MKFLLLSLAVSTGVLFYISGGKGPAMLTTLMQPPSKSTKNPDQTGTESLPGEKSGAPQAKALEERVVQIQGKWYKYRADNRYVIDGVPTYHVPKKLKPKEEPVRAVAAQVAAGTNPAANQATNPNFQKSQALIKMASENPMKIYTPEGFKALKDGLDAMKNSSAEQNKALEALMREP